MASGFYNTFKADLLSGTHNLANGGNTIKLGLLNNSHTFTAENDVWSDISANEISGTGYTTGGATIASQTVSTDDTDDEGVWDAADVSFTSSSFSAYHGVLYNTSVSSKLIYSLDFGGVQTVTTGTFTVVWAAEGIININ